MNEPIPRKEFEVKIDFEEASKAWRGNKRYINGGYFKYKCQYKHTNGKQCYRLTEACKPSERPMMAWEYENREAHELNDEFCKQHARRGSGSR